MRAQCVLDVGSAAHEIDARVEVACGGHRSVYDDGRRVITTHSVDGDPDLQRLRPILRRRL
jgi:hypothetical protein